MKRTRTATRPLTVPRDALPKLTKPEMARLVEIGRNAPFRCYTSCKPATTAKLIDMGLVAKGRRALCMTEFPVSLTPAGREVLASLPERTP